MKRLEESNVLLILLVMVMAISFLVPYQAMAEPLVTSKEAETILGDKVAEPRIDETPSGMAPPGLRYRYPITGTLKQQGMNGSMVIYLYDDKTMAGDDGLFKTPQDFFKRKKQAVINAGKRSNRTEVVEVPGIGDSAYWAPNSYTLHFMSQGTYVSVKINDLKKFSGAGRAELDKKIDDHRRLLAEKTSILIIPRLQTR